MKNRLVTLVLLAGFFAASLISFAPLTTHADATSNLVNLATQGCKGKVSGTQQTSSCEGGYMAGANAHALELANGSFATGLTVCTQNGGSSKSATVQACAEGYVTGWADSDAVKLSAQGKSSLSTVAKSVCGNSASAACKQGVQDYLIGKTEANSCKGLKGNDLKACDAGWEGAKNPKPSTTPAPTTPATNPTAPVTTPATPDPTVSTPDTDKSHATCESSGFNLSWILCPVINGLASAVDGMYTDFIAPMLETQPIVLKDNGDASSGGILKAWSNFRIYGNIFLVIALLVVVFGQGLGGGIVEAYTAKKVLPRLLIAVILVNISIYMVAIAVDITNVLGHGLQSLIQAPFGNSFGYKLSGAGANTGGALELGIIGAGSLGIAGFFGVGGAFAGAVAGAISGFLPFLAVTFLLPAFLIMLAILVTVVIRNGLILFLVLVSPVAFALYCLPNTEKYFRKWWDLLIRTLMVYPIIAVMFALGNVLSVTIQDSSSGHLQSFISSFVAIFAQFVPLMLIPFSFRIAGGVLGKAHDMVRQGTGRVHQGILGDEKDPESLRNRTKYRKDMAMEKSGFSGRQISTAFNPKTWRDGTARRENIAAVRDNRMKRLADKYVQGDSLTANNATNDMFLTADGDMDLALAKRAEAVGKGNMVAAAGWDKAIATARVLPPDSARQLNSSMKLFGTGYQLDEGMEGYRQMANMVAKHTGTDIGIAEDGKVTVNKGDAGAFSQAMAQAQYSAKQAGRYDLSAINYGEGYDSEGGPSKVTGYQFWSTAKPESVSATAEGQLGISGMSSDKKTVDGAALEINQNVTSGKTSHDKILAHRDNLVQGKGIVSPTSKQRKVIDKQIAAIDKYGEDLPPEQSTDFKRELKNRQAREDYIASRGVPPIAEIQPGAGGDDKAPH